MLNVNIWDILWTVINLLVFFLLLRRFLFKPVVEMMERREQIIQDDLNSAKTAKEESEELRAKYEAELADAHKEAVKIANTAKKRAEAESAEIIADAHKEAESLISNAQAAIERDREEAIDSARSEIAGLAVMAASRVIAKNIDEDSNREYAEQLLAEVGADND